MNGDTVFFPDGLPGFEQVRRYVVVTAPAFEPFCSLQGEGPDNALKFDRAPYLSWLRRQRRWGRLAEALWLYARAKGFRHWDRTFRCYTGRGPPDADDPGLPPWIEPGLATRLHLAERLASMNGEIGRAHV